MEEKDNLKNYREKISSLSEDDKIERDIYLKQLADGTLQGPPTGYPSIDKGWLKYYTDENIKSQLNKQTLYESIKERNKDDLGSIAIEFYGKKYTFEELFFLVDKYADRLSSNYGVKEGDYVTICLPSVPNVIIALLALNKIGAIANMVHVLANSDDIMQKVNDTNSKFAITLDAFQNKFEEIIDNTSLEKVLSVSISDSLPLISKTIYNAKNKKEKSKNAKIIDYKEFMSSKPQYKSQAVEYKEGSVAAIVYTSGTTGKPKGVELLNDNFNAMVVNYENSNVILKRGEKFLDVIPPFAAYGLCNSIFLPLSLGLTVQMIAEYDPKTFESLIRKYKPNHYLGVPAQLDSMLSSKKLSKKDLKFLYNVGVGGDSLTEEREKQVLDFLEKHNCKSKINKGYGMTEVGSAAIVSSNTSNKIGSQGIPFVKNNVAIFKPNTEEELGQNEKGEICLSSPTMMKSYFNNPNETKHVIRKHTDGSIWVHTGDIGYLDNDGFLFFCDREKRMIIKDNGYKISPLEIENTLMAHPTVAKAKVIGIDDPNASTGKVPLAIIELKEEYKNQALIIKESISNYCQQKLLPRCWPYDYHFVNDLALNATGKVDTGVLEEEHKTMGR